MGSLLAHHPTECKASSRSFRDFYRSRLMERFFLWPLVMTNSAEMRVLSVGIANFEGEYSTEYPLIMAAALMSTIPMLVMFIFLQKHLIAGISLGGVRK